VTNRYLELKGKHAEIEEGKVTYVVLSGENAERLKRVEVRKYST
jgi:vancomycin permeability regulator SanA